MELTADDLVKAGEDLRVGLAVIPPSRLLRFDARAVAQKDIAPLIRPTLSNVRFLIRILVQYEGSILFPFYVTDTGLCYTQWFLQPYLTHSIRDAARNWFLVTQAKKVLSLAKSRMAPIKEELMVAAWHPKRVAKLIAAAGIEAIDD